MGRGCAGGSWGWDVEVGGGVLEPALALRVLDEVGRVVLVVPDDVVDVRERPHVLFSSSSLSRASRSSGSVVPLLLEVGFRLPLKAGMKSGELAPKARAVENWPGHVAGELINRN
jgi:hypothetical protein